VLWEYAKLNQHIKDLVIQTRSLSETPDEMMLKRLRILERKLAVVLTLVRNNAECYIFPRLTRWAVQSIRLGCRERAEFFGAPTRRYCSIGDVH
jgi:hypothetical protein